MDHPEANAPAGADSCYLPAELQMIVLEHADWLQHPALAQVCRFWRNFIRSSPIVQLNRYFPVYAAMEGFDGSAGEEEFPRPRPWVHRSLSYLRQFTTDKNAKKETFTPCKIEILASQAQDTLPSCRVWPDMEWGLFKDDPVTIFPDVDSSTSLRIAEREIVISFDCCELCKYLTSKENQVVRLGPVATVAGYLGFIGQAANLEMKKCKTRRNDKTWWSPDSVVELWMSREPILVFSPRYYDTDTLRLWYNGTVRQCNLEKVEFNGGHRSSVFSRLKTAAWV